MRALLAALLLLPLATPVRAASDLDLLLDGLSGSGSANRGEVVVEDSITGGGPRRELVVRLTPTGDAKLIADPGASVEVTGASGVRWPEGRRAATAPAETEYFPGGVTLRLPFEQTGPGAIDARVEYFWCFVGYQCFLGEKRIRHTLEDGTG